MPERVINNNFKSVFKFKTYASNSFRQLETDFFIIKNKMKEVFKDIPNYEGLYQVSNYGRVKGLERKVIRSRNPVTFRTNKGRIIKPTTNQSGYLYIGLCKDGKLKVYILHRLIALTFIPNPNNKETINHINGIKSDNNINNLEWNTVSENHKHAYKTGLRDSSHLLGENGCCTGEKNTNSKLKAFEVKQIKDLLKLKRFTQTEIANLYKIGKTAISDIVNNKRWKHL
jgi:hypothetical protein